MKVAAWKQGAGLIAGVAPAGRWRGLGGGVGGLAGIARRQRGEQAGAILQMVGDEVNDDAFAL